MSIETKADFQKLIDVGEGPFDICPRSEKTLLLRILTLDTPQRDFSNAASAYGAQENGLENSQGARRIVLLRYYFKVNLKTGTAEM